MKRSYPYTGPGASPSQAQAPQMTASTTPSSQPTPDYSAYGYGSNSSLISGNVSAGLSQEAQQAQWHQQWQQYYAQQAAGATGAQPQQGAVPNRPPQQMQQPQGPMQTQPYGFQQQPQFYGQQFPPRPSMPPAQQMPNASYAWPNQQQGGAPGFQQPPYNAVLGPQQPANYHHANSNLPPAKRPRYDMNGGPPMGPMNPMANPNAGPGFQAGIGPQAFPGVPNAAAGGNHQNYQGNAAWQPGSARMGPMRGGGGHSPHPGGPSNMAGPMAASPPGVRAPSTSMADRRGNPNRPGRPQAMPNRPALPSAAGKFSGPVGVNAMTSQGRGGFGRPGVPVNMAARRPIAGLRNGIPSGPSGKGRFDQGKGKVNGAIKGSPNKVNGELTKVSAVTSNLPAAPSSKRTFSDFRIKAISIDPIDWQWQQREEETEDEEEADGDEDETMHPTNDVDSVNGSVQGSKKIRTGKRKEKSEVSKEISKLRICFAANQPPPGAPTGPKALTKAAGKEEPEQSAAAEVVPASDEPEWTAFSRGPPQSSTNRISISYASSKRRLVIDSDVIKSIEVNRAKSTLKIVVNVTTAAGVKRRDQLEKKKGEEWVIVKGVLLEGREAEMDNFSAISRRELEKCWRMKGEEEAEGSEQLPEQPLLEDTIVKEEEVEDEEDVADANTEEDETQNGDADVHEDRVDESETGTKTGEGGEEEEEEEAKPEEVELEEEKEMTWEDYASLPPFFRLLARHDGPSEDENHSAVGSAEMTITVMLAEVSPKQELRWIKTGDVEEWLSALPGFQSSFSSTSKIVHAWTDKIHVVDPDPPPTVSDVLQDWVTKSFVGNLGDRKRFLEVHQLQSTSGMMDLICKLVRGERAIPTPNARELGAPIRDAIEGSAFQQNHLTGSISAIIRLVKEYAGMAGVEESTVETRVQGIFMCLPTHQIFRACDGLLKEHLEKQRLVNAGRGKAAAAAALPAGPSLKRVNAEEKSGGDANEKGEETKETGVEANEKGEDSIEKGQEEQRPDGTLVGDIKVDIEPEVSMKVETEAEDVVEPPSTATNGALERDSAMPVPEPEPKPEPEPTL